jgi:hypothetical protein
MKVAGTTVFLGDATFDAVVAVVSLWSRQISWRAFARQIS